MNSLLGIEKEIEAYFTPKDLKIGEVLMIYGRKFLIYDCDNFTKAWFYQNMGMTEFTPVPVKGKAEEVPKMVFHLSFLLHLTCTYYNYVQLFSSINPPDGKTFTSLIKENTDIVIFSLSIYPSVSF